MQAIKPSVERIKQPFFVFLHVFVVRERQSFDCHHHPSQCTIDASGFAADQFKCIGVFLLWHQ
ncbi:Uncharacterised protein [Vibrio cholerae]|nr:Uncharacterised protein [Vibrio cholerae]